MNREEIEKAAEESCKQKLGENVSHKITGAYTAGYENGFIAASFNQGMEIAWIKSNERRPEKEGFYYAKDSVGAKTMVRFYNDHWHSLTGHPVSEWLDENFSSQLPARGEEKKLKKCDCKMDGDNHFCKTPCDRFGY